ncbi:MAG: hypothetical protein NZT61_02790 [Deltaproteobacteria bacterium]|nr:hypothetical protein [Deltaproteobacteria bacterium]MCX7952699.1 hypothetical protein [Deltaproteobacteria bacterium]
MALATIIFALAVFSVIYYETKRNIKIPLRDFPAIEKIRYGIALAGEQGKGVVFTTGLTGIGPLLYACLEILKEVARRCARLGIKLIVPQNDPPSLALVTKTLEQVYAEEGKISRFDPQSVPFLSEEQFAFAAGYIGLVKRQDIGCAFLFGSFAGEALILAESGKNAGAFQVAGSVSPEQLAFFVATCDETAFGDEVYAISAKLSQNWKLLSNLRIADILKLVILTFLIIGSVCLAFELEFFERFRRFLFQVG